MQEEIPIILTLNFAVAIISTNRGDFSLGEEMLNCLMRSNSVVFTVHQTTHTKT